MNKGEVTAASVLEEVKIAVGLQAEFYQESADRIALVFRAFKVLRESASGEGRRNLGEVHSAADASHPGTCEVFW